MAKEISVIRQEAQQVQNATQVGENTAQRVGGVLTDLVDKIATILGATYMGVATPTTNPGAPDGNVFYFATQAGTYTNFGSVVLNEGLNILLWNGTSWAVTNVMNIVQELGDSENAVMSQKAVTDELAKKANQTDVEDTLAGKVDNADIVQKLGNNNENLISQQATTKNLLSIISIWDNAKIENNYYLRNNGNIAQYNATDVRYYDISLFKKLYLNLSFSNLSVGANTLFVYAFYRSYMPSSSTFISGEACPNLSSYNFSGEIEVPEEAKMIGITVCKSCENNNIAAFIPLINYIDNGWYDLNSLYQNILQEKLSLEFENGAIRDGEFVANDGSYMISKIDVSEKEYVYIKVDKLSTSSYLPCIYSFFSSKEISTENYLMGLKQNSFEGVVHVPVGAKMLVITVSPNYSIATAKSLCTIKKLPTDNILDRIKSLDKKQYVDYSLAFDDSTKDKSISDNGNLQDTINTTILLYKVKSGDTLIAAGANGSYLNCSFYSVDSISELSESSFISLQKGIKEETTFIAPEGAKSFVICVARAKMFKIKKELVETSEEYNKIFAKDHEVNLANASMRCDYCIMSLSLTMAVGYYPYTLALDYNERNKSTFLPPEGSEYSISKDGFPGYGIKIVNGKVYRIQCITDDDKYYSMGFWLTKDTNITVSNTSGPLLSDIPANNIGAAYSFADEIILNILTEKDSYVYINIIVKRTNSYSTVKLKFDNSTTDIYMYNFTSFGRRTYINPNIEYPTIYQKFGSSLVGKTFINTGDSNGGIVKYQRFWWVGLLLGMRMVEASNGGWAMQGRVLSNEEQNYGWLYYHKWRNKVLAIPADIYYFNQCTNDNNGGQSGKFGDGTWDCVKEVLDIYPKIQSLLEAGNLDAQYEGQTIRQICHEKMTTLGCTGAYIHQISNEKKNAICVIDSTIGAIGSKVNYLTGGPASSGLIESNILEKDENGDVCYAPYLLTDVDGEGYPTSSINNGTITGSSSIDDVTASSSLDDGNNYSLFAYYALKNYGIDINTDDITDKDTIEAISKLCHQFYENSEKYGRITPELMKKNMNTEGWSDLENNFVYRKGVDNLRSIFRVPYIEAGWNTGVNMWNAGRISGDGGHYNRRGHYYLGVTIAHQLNMIGRMTINDDKYIRPYILNDDLDMFI